MAETLSCAEPEDFGAHLLGCAECQRAVVEGAAIRAVLRLLRKKSEPPPDTGFSYALPLRARWRGGGDPFGLSAAGPRGVMLPTVCLDDGRQTLADALILDVTGFEIRKVGGVKRFLIGAFAGRPTLGADLRFEDGDTGRELGL